MLRNIALSGATLFAAVVASSAVANAQTFPTNAKWTPLHRHGEVYNDPIQHPDGYGPVDAVGNDQSPGIYIFSDGHNLFFRLRMDQAILNGDGSDKNDYNDQFGWSCAIDTDMDLNNFEVAGALNGNADDVEFLNLVGLVKSYNVTSHARQATATDSMFASDPDFFADFAIDNTELTANGVTATTPVRFSCGTHDFAMDAPDPQDLVNVDWIGVPGPSDLPDIVSDSYLCGPTGCQVCTTTSMCGSDCMPCGGDAPVCALLEGVCDSGDLCDIGDTCPSGETCDAAWFCTSCQNNSDCPENTPICGASGACTGCTMDNDCSDPQLPRCDTGTGTCVACVDSNDCSPPRAFCDGATNTCTNHCTGDGSPSCPDPGAPACNKSGPQNGTCTECSATNNTLCDGTATPLCLVQIGNCVECRNTLDCALGSLCDQNSHTCGVILGPDAGAVVPDAAVRPDAVVRSDAAEGTPDARQGTPDAPVVVTPDATVTTADARITTADAAGGAPDAKSGPDAKAGTPDARRMPDAGGTAAVAGNVEGGGMGCAIAVSGSHGLGGGLAFLLMMFGAVVLRARRRR